MEPVENTPPDLVLKQAIDAVLVICIAAIAAITLCNLHARYWDAQEHISGNQSSTNRIYEQTR